MLGVGWQPESNRAQMAAAQGLSRVAGLVALAIEGAQTAALGTFAVEYETAFGSGADRADRVRAARALHTAVPPRFPEHGAEVVLRTPAGFFLYTVDQQLPSALECTVVDADQAAGVDRAPITVQFADLLVSPHHLAGSSAGFVPGETALAKWPRSGATAFYPVAILESRLTVPPRFLVQFEDDPSASGQPNRRVVLATDMVRDVSAQEEREDDLEDAIDELVGGLLDIRAKEHAAGDSDEGSESGGDDDAEIAAQRERAEVDQPTSPPRVQRSAVPVILTPPRVRRNAAPLPRSPPRGRVPAPTKAAPSPRQRAPPRDSAPESPLRPLAVRKSRRF